MPDSPPPLNTDDRRERLERIARDAPPVPPADDQSSIPSNRGTHPSGDYYDSNAIITGICGLVFLYFAWRYLSVSAVSGASAIYAASIQAVPWLAGACGLGLLFAAGLAAMRVRIGILVELAAAALATLTCIGIGVIWMMEGDQEGFLLLIFALINGHAALTCYRIWKRK